MNATLREWAFRTGRPWTENIAPMCWRYVPSYVQPEDEERLRPAVERLATDHGVVLEKFRGERAKKGGDAQRLRGESDAPRAAEPPEATAAPTDAGGRRHAGGRRRGLNGPGAAP